MTCIPVTWPVALNCFFSEMNENAWAYKIAGTHRHTGEIEQELSALANEGIRVSFTPHIVPMTRGVLVMFGGFLVMVCCLF